MAWMVPQIAWRHTGAKGRFAMVAALAAIVIMSPESTYCSCAEYIVQEAGACLLRPEMRREWARIDAVYGTGKQDCPAFLTQLNDINVGPHQAKDAAAWGDANASNVRDYWQSALGTDFCADMLRRQSAE